MLFVPFAANAKKPSGYIYNFLFPVLALFLPVLFWSLEWEIAPRITTSQSFLFEAFGFFAALLMLITAWKEITELTETNASFEEWVNRFLPHIVSFFFLYLVVEFHEQSWDYESYDVAFRAIINGGNPYAHTLYIYPPPYAEVMASVYRFSKWLFPFLNLAQGNSNSWLFVFYIHHSFQFFSANLIYQLSRRFSNQLGIKEWISTLFVSGLFVFNYPLVRNIHLNQVTIFSSVALLFTITLIMDGKDFRGGVALAIGGLIKIYPFVLGLPLLIMKKWKGLLGVFTGVAAVVLVQTKFGTDILIWKQFINLYLNFPVSRESSRWFRNSSLLSFTRNTSHFLGLPENAVLPIYALVFLGIFLWLGFRLLQRESFFQRNEEERIILKSVGNLIDFSVLFLLLGPSAWVHHYLFAIPLAIWAFAQCDRAKIRWLWFGLASIFIIPPFDIYPFSYIRLVGLFILLVITSPAKKPSLPHK